VTQYLDTEDLLFLVQDIMVGPVRDLGLLASAAARPATTYLGVDVYPSFEEKAAALLHSLVCNHSLVDGNKRIGWHATVVFARLNGFKVDMTEDAAFALVMDVASGTERDISGIAARLAFRA